MTISFALFFGLVFLSVVPPYLFSLYLMYTLRQVSISITKLVEHDAMHANSGTRTVPLFSKTLDRDELLDLISKTKKQENLQSEAAPPVSSRGYL